MLTLLFLNKIVYGVLTMTYTVESLQQEFPYLSPEILASLMPVVVGEMRSYGPTDWTDDAFFLWMDQYYNPLMRQREEEILENYY